MQQNNHKENLTNHEEAAEDKVQQDNHAVQNEEKKSAELTREQLENALQLLTKEKDSIFNRLLVSEADMKNLRRRTELDLAHAHKYALEKFAKELLPVIDALEFELNAINEAAIASEELTKFKEGSELIYRMLLNAFEKFGIKQIQAIGEKLNPELHQAITIIPDPAHETNTIIQVMQNGYVINDRLLRAAQVIVAQ